MVENFPATASIKLVIWDLDDTFWEGTLSEGGIKIIDRNVEIVKTLVDRGIMSSIVSKNDIETAREVLVAAGIWDYFIFPKVSWNPKGSQVSEILDQTNLRPDNVLFIDDNAINIEEVRHRFPMMAVGYPHDIIPVLLDLNQAAGKDDKVHSRLKQYKQLEQKATDHEQSALSNIEFLQQCNIKIRFDYDIERNLDRVVELINRSNQLNFTKVRLETPVALEDFKAQLKRHDFFAACVFASDRYGSHGLIGFYLQHKNEQINKLVHYVWSCRMMNTGLEQYVYERLGKPQIDVVEPTSNPIVVFDQVDWIAESSSDGVTPITEAPRLLLIGSCDLTAVASYCSPNRVEFVNGVKNGVMTRYDDFGFILGSREKISGSKALARTPAWDAADFAAFHEGLANSEILIVSLSAAMKGVHCLLDDGVVVRVHPEGLGHHIDFNPRASFLKRCAFYAHTIDQKIDLLRRSLQLIDQSSANAKCKFLLGANTRDVGGSVSEEDRALLSRYNEACHAFCESNSNWRFVSIDEVVAYDKLLDDRHYTRMGYLCIANFINTRLDRTQVDRKAQTASDAPSERDLVDLIRAGRKMSRLNTFGGQRRGALSPIKQAVKLMPLSRIIRKVLPKRRAVKAKLAV